MIGVDLAKSVFQLHAASPTGQVLFRKKVSRPAFARFMAEQLNRPGISGGIFN
jgi:hypothetical protein